MGQNESRVSNWRNERFAKMLESGNGADVFFLVGREGEEKQLIAAHKLLLSAMSDVFEGQFHRFNEMAGSQEGAKEWPIEVPDISPDAFSVFLKIIYADNLSGINKQNLLDVYSAGKKYMIDAVIDQCRQWLLNGKNLDVDNVFSVLKFAQRQDDKSLIELCWAFVDDNAIAVLKSEEFFELNQTDLCQLFSRDTLAADEFILYQRLNDWVIRKCDANGLEETPENRQKLIGEAIYQIRFPLFTQQEFTKCVVPLGLLTNEDIIAMYIHYSNCNADRAEMKYPNRFNLEPRSSQQESLMKRRGHALI